MKKSLSLSVLILLFLGIFQGAIAASTAPTWIANPFMESGVVNVKTNTATSVGNQQTQTVTFNKGFQMTPRVAYGIMTYRSNFVFIPGYDKLIN